MNIGFIGLGKLGLPCAEVFALKFPVFGFDVIDRSQDVKNIQLQNSTKEVVQKSDFIFIAVPTPHHNDYGGTRPTLNLEPKDFDYSFVKSVFNEIDELDTKGKAFVLISTVLPGTMRHDIAKNRLYSSQIIYNPYLIAMGTEAADMVKPEMLIVGTSEGIRDKKVEQLENLYKSLMKQDTRFVMGTWEEAESIKIFYNTFISTKISLVNMIQDVAQSIGNMNCDIVANALAESEKRIMSAAYMKPGMGDGGPCHPRDNIALRLLAKKLELGYDLFSGIVESREVQAQNMARFIGKHGRKICILGRSFKPNVGYADGSYSLLVAHFLVAAGCEVEFDSHDPNGDTEVFLLAHRGEFYDYPFPEGAIVIDPWREFEVKNGIKCIPYGNTRPR